MGNIRILEHSNQVELNEMERVKKLALSEKIEIAWVGIDGVEFGRYEMRSSGADKKGIAGWLRQIFCDFLPDSASFYHDDIISVHGDYVQLLVRRLMFLPCAEKLAKRLAENGYRVEIKKDFVVRD